MLRIHEPFHGAVLNHRHGQTAKAGLEIPVWGTAPADEPVTVNGVPVDLTAAEGLDLLPGVQAPASGAAATGVASAAMTVAGVTGLYTIDLTTGAATRVGPLGSAISAPKVGA